MEHKIVDFAIQLAVILFAISFHESAHAFAALQFGDTTARDLGRISLNPMRHIDPIGSIVVPLVLYFFAGFIFGSAKPTPVDLRNTKDPRLANLVVSAAGPLSNFLLAGLGLLVFAVIQRADRQAMIDLYSALKFGQFSGGALAPITYLLFFFVLVNVMLGVFNLLPIPPSGRQRRAPVARGRARGAPLRGHPAVRLHHPSAARHEPDPQSRALSHPELRGQT